MSASIILSLGGSQSRSAAAVQALASGDVEPASAVAPFGAAVAETIVLDLVLGNR